MHLFTRAGASTFLLVVATVGCAARHPVSFTDRFVTQGEPAIDLGGPPQASTDQYVAKLRALAVQARPRAKTATPEMLEARDQGLRDALSVLAVAPSATAHRAVALEYRRLGISDAAYTHISAAIRLNPTDATAYDLRARIWRAWGLPGLGLPDARRAVALAPHSATAWNTLGLMLEGRGSVTLAIRAYLRAVQIDREAGYAWNNLCRTWTSAGEGAAAVPACRRTIELDPSLTGAQIALFKAEQLGAPRPPSVRASEHAAAAARSAR